MTTDNGKRAMLSDADRRKIITMYKAGKRTAEITKATGAARSTIYFVLNEEGITPSRQGRARTGPSGSDLSPKDYERTLDWALERIANLEHRNAELETRLRAARDILDT